MKISPILNVKLMANPNIQLIFIDLIMDVAIATEDKKTRMCSQYVFPSSNFRIRFAIRY